MSKVLCVAGLFLYCSIPVAGQLSWQPRSGSYSSRPLSVFSFADDPAALPAMKKTVVGFFGEKKFLLNELGDYAAAACVPSGPGTFGFLFQYNGSSYFRRTSAALAYGRTLAEKIDLAIQFNYDAFALSGFYGKASAVYAKAGFMVRLSPKLRSGITVSNPFGGKFGREKQEKVASVYSAGMGYDVSDKFYLGAKLLKQEGREITLQSDMQYCVVPQLVISAGFSSSTAAGWLGIGWIKGSLRVDISAGFQQQLGISPGTMLQFTPKKMN